MGRQVKFPLLKSRGKDPLKRELYILSHMIARNIIDARDSSFQEILILRGDILIGTTKWGSDPKQNTDYQKIITSINGDYEDDYKISKCRYGKVIIFVNADGDGVRLANSLINLFYNHTRPLVEDGRIFLVRTPLFSIALKDKASEMRFSNNKMDMFFYNQAELDSFLFSLEMMGIEKNDLIITSTILANTDSNLIGEFAMNPQTRRIGKIQISDNTKGDKWYIQDIG